MKIQIEQITEMINTIFKNAGVTDSISKELTEILMESHIKNYEAHGLARVPMYVDDIISGKINPNAEITVINEAPSTAFLNGNNGIGPIQMKRAMQLAIKKAQTNGISAITMQKSNDIARLGTYVEMAANEGLLALLFVNDGGANPAVCPTGTYTPFLSTNPMAAGIPTGKGWPIIIDISTATVALGRLKQAVNLNEQVPTGWLIEQDGNSTNDPNSFFREDKPSAILPLGGLLRGHKGYALSLLVDILAGGLSGTGLSTGDRNHPEKNGIFMIAINPDYFVSRDQLQNDIDEMIAKIKSLPANGENKVMMPGERHMELKNKIPTKINIDPDTWSKLKILFDQKN